MKKRSLSFLVGLLTLSFLPTQARAWGDDGHRIVARIAAQGLTPKTRKAVMILLGLTQDSQVERGMGAFATWADEVRSWQQDRVDQPTLPPPNSLKTDAEAIAFVMNPKNNGQPNWHFLNLPKDYSGPYKGNLVGVRRENVVTAIRECIQVLKTGDNDHINRKQALRLLMHYIGDIHQPLHCGCGYYTKQGTLGTLVSGYPPPQDASHDVGGNSIRLKYTPLEFSGADAASGNHTLTTKLHSFWDTPVVMAAQKYTLAQLGKSELEDAESRYVSYLSSKKVIDHWRFQQGDSSEPGDWAVESVAVAKTIYDALEPGTLSVAFSPRLTGKATLRRDYLATNTSVANGRLARAGFRLAATLNAIFD